MESKVVNRHAVPNFRRRVRKHRVILFCVNHPHVKGISTLEMATEVLVSDRPDTTT
jgi:hypothetical protein